MDQSTKEPPALIHYTEGGPWFEETRNCPYADLWVEEWRDMALPKINP